MGKGVKSLQFKARVLKSEALKQCRTRVLYRLYHCSVRRQGVMEHDCSHSAMTAQASTSSITAKRGRITPLAAESQWCGLSMLILIRVARPDPTDGFANLHRYVQLPVDISSPLLEDRSVISPSVHSESNAPSSSVLSPSVFCFF